MKAFIFDLDGVIVDTAKYHYLAWKQLANELGFNFSIEQNEQLKGVSRVRSLDILLNIGNIELSEERKQTLLEEKNNEYLEYVDKMTSEEILPGIDHLLNYLEEKNIKFALGSASKNAKLILKKVGLLDSFTAIVDGNNVSKAKPDPEVFNIAAQKLNEKQSNCIVVEDALAGIQAANFAGMTSVAIGDEKILHEADYNLANTKELTINFVRELIE
jgi:beta-phosphoglucomutase